MEKNEKKLFEDDLENIGGGHKVTEEELAKFEEVMRPEKEVSSIENTSAQMPYGELSEDNLEKAVGGNDFDTLKSVNEERPGSFYTEKIGKDDTKALTETRTKGALARISSWFKSLFRGRDKEQENTKER